MNKPDNKERVLIVLTILTTVAFAWCTFLQWRQTFLS